MSMVPVTKYSNCPQEGAFGGTAQFVNVSVSCYAALCVPIPTSDASNVTHFASMITSFWSLPFTAFLFLIYTQNKKIFTAGNVAIVVICG